MSSRFEADKQYLLTALKSIYFFISLLSGVAWIFEKLGIIGANFTIPHWAMLAWLFLFLSLAQFKAFEENFNELEKLKAHPQITYDFRLHLAIPVQHVHIPMMFNLSSGREVEVPVMSITIWNKGEQHFQVAACHLAKLSPDHSRKTIKTDLTVQPARPEELNVTRPILELLSSLSTNIHWEQIFGRYLIEIMVECRAEQNQQSVRSDPKPFDVEVRKTGRLAVDIDILPHA